MKIQCDVCEKAEAEVLCCADEAVLCKGCDANVHAANKLSQKHQRHFLLKHSSSGSTSTSSTSYSSSSQLPLCEKCQERKGYVFCLEDRALLCRQCDISAHAASPCILSHQRFLISGVKVSLDSSPEKSDISFSDSSRNHPSRLAMPMEASFDFPADKESMTAMTNDLEAASTETATFPSEPHILTETDWLFDEIYGINDFNFFEFSEVGSSRINSQ